MDTRSFLIQSSMSSERKIERARGWLITVQAPENSDDKWRWKMPEAWEEEISYKCQCYEKGREAKTIHTHVLIYFRSLKRSNSLAKLVIGCNIGSEVDVQPLRGKWSDARAYVLKQDSTKIQGRPPTETGKCPRDTSKKQEVEAECEKIVETIREDGLKGVVDSMAEYILKYPSGCKLIKELTGKRSEKRTVKVTVVWGDAGTGKSTWVQQEARENWEKDDIYHFTKVGGSRDTVWFNGYSGQKCIILDDVNGRTMPLDYMLKILGNDPLDVEVKGGREPALWEEVLITSNWDPEKWYGKVWEECPETKLAFFRRIARIIHVEKTYNESGEGVVTWNVQKEERVHIMRKDFEIKPQWATTPRWIRERRRRKEEEVGMRDNDFNVMEWNRYEEERREETPRSGEGLQEIGYMPQEQHDTPGKGMYWGGADDVKERRGCVSPVEHDRELLKSRVFHIFCDEFNRRRSVLGVSELGWEEIATGVREGTIQYDEKEWLEREKWRNLTGNENIGKYIAEKEAEMYTWMENEFGVVELE